MVNLLKRIMFLTVIILLLGHRLLSSESISYRGPESGPKKWANRRLLVKYKEDIAYLKKAQVHFSVGAYVVKTFDLPHNLELIEVAKGISVQAAQEFYQEDENVLYAEPDYPLHAFLEPPPTNPGLDDEPNREKDPKLKEQWGLDNQGQHGGLIDADINAVEMWAQFSEGDKRIVMAVIDTGINYKHSDLKANIWINESEIPGNGIDDDNNGVIDDVHGFNALDNSGDPMDDHGHGSHCAGIIGAEHNNYFGGSGVMPKVTLIGCKFLSADGGGETSGAIACLEYLRKLKTRAKFPIDIVATSNSWGGSDSSEALKDAIKAHQDEGILFIAAAGNESMNNDDYPSYPANFPLTNVIAVAATDRHDKMSYFSNFGKRTVHVGAPGEDILSTVLGNNKYETMSGTSMATPFVTGLVGMIKASFPDYNYIKIKNLIIAGGTPIADLQDHSVSGRRIRAVGDNGLGSLTCQDQIVKGRLSPSSNNLLIAVHEKILLSAMNINCEKANGELVIPINHNHNHEDIKLKDDALIFGQVNHDGVYSEEWFSDIAGDYEFMFPSNDLVSVHVYDPHEFKAYTHEITDFTYRHIQGQALLSDDEWVGSITSPFPIPFAGSKTGFTKLAIGSNGTISPTNFTRVTLENHPLPHEDMTSLIALFWDDLTPFSMNWERNRSFGDIYYEVLGEEPNRELVIEWRNFYHYFYDDPATFQAVFLENSPNILFNYLDVDFGDQEVNYGASATIGMQTTKDMVHEVDTITQPIANNTSILFRLVE